MKQLDPVKHAQLKISVSKDVAEDTPSQIADGIFFLLAELGYVKR